MRSCPPHNSTTESQHVWPLDLGPAGEAVFLVLSGTGLRYRQNLSVVVTTRGGNVNGEVLFVGAAPGFTGLDQVNVRIPRALIGRHEIDLALLVAGKTANVVRVNIQGGTPNGLRPTAQTSKRETPSPDGAPLFCVAREVPFPHQGG